LKAFSAYPKLEISLLIAGEIGAETRLEKELTFTANATSTIS
jgi:hypothetical protein